MPGVICAAGRTFRFQSEAFSNVEEIFEHVRSKSWCHNFEKVWSQDIESRGAQKMSEGDQKRANKSFSIDLRLLAGSAVVHSCASGRVLHAVVHVLGRF